MHILQLALLTLFVIPNSENDRPKRCQAGQFLKESGARSSTCQPCEQGTFMPLADHTTEHCWSCTKPDIRKGQKEVKSCTLTTDTEIGCQSGYYRTGPDGALVCQRCTDCRDLQQFETQSCGPDRDTICCPDSGMELKISADGSQICVTSPNQARTIHRCPSGQFLNYSTTGVPSCVRCREGTFISEGLHSFKQCRPCTEADQYQHQIVIRNCTSISDTELGCAQGYFSQPAPAGHVVECQKCKSCDEDPTRPHEIRPCELNSDTVCCPLPDMQVTKDSADNNICTPQPMPDGPVTTLCRKGFRVHNQTNCRPCESGFFRHQDYHSFTHCEPCQQADPYKYEIELRGCSSTQDAVIVCVSGYFRVESAHGDECLKCSDCSHDAINKYIGKECSLFHNTVCCPLPDMEVSKDNKCKDPEHCGRGSYLSEVEPGMRTCMSCPNGTFMSEERHTNIECRRCTVPEDFNREIEAHPCNATHDTDIVCEKGFFRDQYTENNYLTGDCIPCSKCASQNLTERRACGRYSDAECCPEEGMVARKNEDTGEVECKARDSEEEVQEVLPSPRLRNGSCAMNEHPAYRIGKTNQLLCERWTSALSEQDLPASCGEGDVIDSKNIPRGLLRNGSCRAGEYMVPLAIPPGADGEILCAFCPKGYFMDQQNHQESQCKPCTLPSGASISGIRQTCKRDQDTLFESDSVNSEATWHRPVSFFLTVAALLILPCVGYYCRRFSCRP